MRYKHYKEIAELMRDNSYKELICLSSDYCVAKDEILGKYSIIPILKDDKGYIIDIAKEPELFSSSRELMDALVKRNKNV